MGKKEEGVEWTEEDRAFFKKEGEKWLSPEVDQFLFAGSMRKDPIDTFYLIRVGDPYLGSLHIHVEDGIVKKIEPK